MSKLETLALPADRLPGDVVVALFYKDQRPLEGPAAVLDWRLDGYLTELLSRGELTGKAGEHILVQGNRKIAAEWVLLVGGGKWYGLSADTYASLLNHVIKIASQAGFREIAICLAPHEDADEEILTKQLQSALSHSGATLDVCRLSCVPLLG